MTAMKEYLEAIREKVCAVCVDSDEEGKCTLNSKEICAVEMFLPKIVEIVKNRKSNDIWDYYEEMKSKICAECNAKTKDDSCYLREDANCSLDRYFPLIVDAIRKVEAGVN